MKKVIVSFLNDFRLAIYDGAILSLFAWMMDWIQSPDVALIGFIISLGFRLERKLNN